MSKKHLLAISLIIAVGILGAVIIVATAPSKKNISSDQAAVPTADQSDRLNGGKLEGQLVFSRQGALWLWQGENATRLPLDPGKSVAPNTRVQLVQPALSPDGSKIAYIRQDESFADLWTASANGSNPRQLSNNRGAGVPRSESFTNKSLWAFSPVWSADGAQIAYLSDNGTDDLTLFSTAAASFAPRQLSTLAVGNGGLQRPSWSPKGDAVAVGAFENGKLQIFSVRTANRNSTQLTSQPDGAYDPAWSPDGKWIAYIAHKGNGGEMWLMQADGSNPMQLSPQNSRSPVWSPDSKKLAYLGQKDGWFEIFTLELGPSGSPTTSPKQISNNAKLDGADGLSWSK